DRDQHQIALPRKMLGRGLGGLCGGREMDEAVGNIDACAREHPGAFGGLPFRCAEDFVNKLSHSAAFLLRGPQNDVTTPCRVRSSCSVHCARWKRLRRLRTIDGRFSGSRMKPERSSSSSRCSKKRMRCSLFAGTEWPSATCSAGVASLSWNHS